jgi:hypothetical protein
MGTATCTYGTMTLTQCWMCDRLPAGFAAASGCYHLSGGNMYVKTSYTVFGVVSKHNKLTQSLHTAEAQGGLWAWGVWSNDGTPRLDNTRFPDCFLATSSPSGYSSCRR